MHVPSVNLSWSCNDVSCNTSLQASEGLNKKINWAGVNVGRRRDQIERQS